ncbi:unknow [Vibrio campbellii]|nr:unknow [Vibrio campbellii]
MSKSGGGDDVEALCEFNIKLRNVSHGNSPKSLSTRGVLLLLFQQALRPLLQPKASLVLK